MPSCQFLLGLPGFLLPEIVTSFGIILCTFISSASVCVTCIISLIRLLVTLSTFDPSVALHQKSISVTSNICYKICEVKKCLSTSSFPKFLSCIILSVLSCQLFLDLLLPGGFLFVIRFGIQVSDIPCTCSVFYFIRYRLRYLHNLLLFPRLFTTNSNIRFVVSLFGHISQLHVITLFLMVLHIILLLLLFMFLFQSIPFSTVMAFFPSRFRSFIAVSDVLSFVISTYKYSYFTQHLISCPFSSVKFRYSPSTHMYCALLMSIFSLYFWYSSISLRVM